MQYKTPQPMSTFALLETAKRLLSAESVRIAADDGGPENVCYSSRRDDLGMQAVRFDQAGNPTLGRCNPDTLAFTPDA